MLLPIRPAHLPVKVVIRDAATAGDLSDLLDRAGLCDLLADLAADPAIVILVDLAGFSAADPGVPARAVEALIDAIGARRPAACSPRFLVAASADGSAAWAGNRDVHARAEIAGYRYVTDTGIDYDIVDLADDVIADGFAAGSALAGTPAARIWADADVRIVIAGLRCDAGRGFVGALETMLGALPATDPNREYRQRRDVGEVATALLDAMPPQLAIIDARASGGPWLVSRDIVLADYAAALKLGIDPAVSPLFATLSSARPVPAAHAFDGDPTPAPERAPEAISEPAPTPWAAKLARARAANADFAALTDPWLQMLDREAFPPLHPIDARMNAALAGLDGGAVHRALDLLLALAADGLTFWQTLYDKDALERRVVALGIDPASVPVAAFDAMVASLDSLAPVARCAPLHADALRWRKIGGAIVFAYARELAIPFEHFVARVDIGHAIAFMADYLGGIVLPHAEGPLPPSGAQPPDGGGRQLERNLYLPQPNYLVLFGGKPIDVTKIEIVRRTADFHQLYWQTLFSSNDTARADDGIISFRRTGTGTAVEIIGQQDFTLPPFWQLFDVSLLPALETALVTHAYQSFFAGTLANFEALAEGRDIAIGRDPALPRPPPAEALEALAGRVADVARPWLATLRGERGDRRAGRDADADGYVHGRGV